MTGQDKAAGGEWIGCACPHCRAVFRVAGAMRGRQVTCPSCREVSGIPLGAGLEDSSIPPVSADHDARRNLPTRPDAEASGGERARSEPENENENGDENEDEDGDGDEGENENENENGDGDGDGDGDENEDGDGEENEGENRYQRTDQHADAQTDGVTTEVLPDGRVRVRKRTRKKKAAAPTEEKPLGWELLEGPGKVSRSPVQRLSWLGLAVIAVALGTFGLITTIQNSQQRDRERVASQRRAGQEEQAGKATPVPDAAAVLAALTPQVERFLRAASVEALLESVRGTDESKTRIRRHYQTHEQKPVEFRAIAPDGKLTRIGDLYSVMVELQDFSRRELAVEQVGEGFLVDWESWVGYSERSWASFLAERPREPTLFRVLSRQIPYYNGAFRDESEWQSFRFRSADEEHYVYAYAREGSAAARALFPPERREKDAAFVVRIRFPDSPDGAGAEGDRAIAQVVVEEVVCSGWVREGGTTAVR